MVHPHLLQVFQKIEEEDGKNYGFLFHDQKPFLEKDSAYKDKEGFAEKCVSSKSAMRNTKNVSHAPVSQQNQIDPKQESFLKIFYGGQKLDPRVIHPSLLQTLQKIDEDEGKDNQFFSHRPKLFSKGSSTYEHKEEEKDLHVFQPSTNLFHSLLLEESMQQFWEEKSHGKPKNRRTQGMEKIADIPSIFVKDNIDSRNVEENLESIFIFPPLHSFSIHESNITLAMLLTYMQCILPFYQELVRRGSYFS